MSKINVALTINFGEYVTIFVKTPTKFYYGFGIARF